MCWWLSLAKQESQAAYLLRKHEVSRLDIVNFISHGTRKDEPSQSSDLGNQPTGDEQAGGGGNVWKTSRRILTNLLAWAASIR
ncbi:ATP-dependent Clp protease ATP-binding subunit [Salmonella enterica subsp. enterica]|uniref:ATP-dependent Clp protease ATP-binding subunit n=1 Tax=Salmonella enterica I TaxID=59201 RepID=A0A447U649_SALET|nr:ATP-dependent Clp protease ATP-binding subunit [Salmonella enterica subsp. enterica]